MECPDCGLAVIVENGHIGQHLRPTDLQVCGDNPAPAATPDATEKPTPAKKAPAKKAAPKSHG